VIALAGEHISLPIGSASGGGAPCRAELPDCDDKRSYVTARPTGTGDAGGMNVYIVEVAKRLRRSGDRGGHLSPRATSRVLPPGHRDGAGRIGASCRGRPLRGAGQERVARASCAGSPPGCCAPRPPTTRVTMTCCTPTTAVRAGRLGGPSNAGEYRWCTRCTPWPGQERFARPGGLARTGDTGAR